MSLRYKLKDKMSKNANDSIHASNSGQIMDSGLSQLTTNKMNDKVDTKFSQMHSNFILLKEKENKLNYHIKKEEILKQKSQNLPEHIFEKYGNSSKMPSRVQTVYGMNKKHFGSVSGNNKSFQTASPDLFKSNLMRKKNSMNDNSQTEIQFKNLKTIQSEGIMRLKRSLKNDDEEEYKNAKIVENLSSRQISNNKKLKNNFEMNPSMGSEGLKNMSMTKIHNRFNKMISEFDNIDVNQSYLDNGFQNMNNNFGDINQSNSRKNQVYSGTFLRKQLIQRK
jgi:hypothetical protein